jgi:AmmeMemoRadiSam system protein B
MAGSMTRRRPAVAGYFYPAGRRELISLIEDCFRHEHGPGRLPPAGVESPLVALISPHAGYIYSGPVAAHGYLLASGLRDVDTYVVVGPNHYGYGNPLAVYPPGYWTTPLGDVEIDTQLTERLMKRHGALYPDVEAHAREHSIEVQVPFLQYIRGGGLKLLPICMGIQDMDAAVELGRALADVVRDWPRRVLLIASTDFTHYEPHEAAKSKDLAQVQHILRMDVKAHYAHLYERDVSMCGYGPTAVIMEAARRLGATWAELLKYATSGDTSGNRDSVVGYASIAFYKEGPAPQG